MSGAAASNWVRPVDKLAELNEHLPMWSAPPCISAERFAFEYSTCRPPRCGAPFHRPDRPVKASDRGSRLWQGNLDSAVARLPAPAEVTEITQLPTLGLPNRRWKIGR